MKFALDLLILSVAIFLVAKLLPAIHIKDFATAVVVAVVYSVINVLLGWFLRTLTLPLTILTFGLFKIVINAVLLWITDLIIKDFRIKGFGWTIVAALLIAVIDTFTKSIVWGNF
ncbi:MAG: phage holin family protein [Chitinispirillaceae bacterium]